MGNCKVYWDDLSYQLANDNSNYSIQNVNGQPYKITWDTNQQHIINNPNNFSYSLTTSSILIAERMFSYNSFPINPYCESRRNTIDIQIYNSSLYNASGITNSTGGQTVPANYTLTLTQNLSGNLVGGQSFNVSLFHKSYCNYGRVSINGGSIGDFGSGILRYIQKIIRIIDNGVTYDYPIINNNSVNVVNSTGYNNIIIEGNSYRIHDVNSARKDCTEQCPNGTITCDCNNVRCCYQSVYYGYQLVKTINL